MTNLAYEIPERYTYKDYLGWDDNLRWELIDGDPIMLAPAPRVSHQIISARLFFQLEDFLKDKECEALYAPVDVRLGEEGAGDDEIDTVVQPDILVVCDSEKLDEFGCVGAPDLIIEILSPGTSAKDQIQKTELYERYGVREFWTVHPTDKIAVRRVLGADGKWGTPEYLEGKGRHAVTVLPGFDFDFDLVFPPEKKAPVKGPPPAPPDPTRRL